MTAGWAWYLQGPVVGSCKKMMLECEVSISRKSNIGYYCGCPTVEQRAYLNRLDASFFLQHHSVNRCTSS